MEFNALVAFTGKGQLVHLGAITATWLIPIQEAANPSSYQVTWEQDRGLCLAQKAA